jgi:hypothetical protein
MRPSELCNAERFEIEIGNPVSKASARKGRATSARKKNCILGKSHVEGPQTLERRETGETRMIIYQPGYTYGYRTRNAICSMQHAAQESVVKVGEYVTVIILRHDLYFIAVC